MESAALRLAARHRFSELAPNRISLIEPPTSLELHFQSESSLSFCVSPSLITPHGWLPNVDGISIAYAFRPELRNRLTLGGLTFPRKP